jgi:hypothetical protein
MERQMLAITCAAATIIWGFWVSSIANRFGPDVGARFLERGAVIPSMNNADLSARSLSLWLRDNATARWARPYRNYVMPLDAVYMLLLGGFLGVGSLSCADAIFWPTILTLWQRLLVITLPVLYVVSDAIEDVLIFILLQKSNLVSPSTFAVMRQATQAKKFFVSAALVQTLVLGIWATLFAEGR